MQDNMLVPWKLSCEKNELKMREVNVEKLISVFLRLICELRSGEGRSHINHVTKYLEKVVKVIKKVYLITVKIKYLLSPLWFLFNFKICLYTF